MEVWVKERSKILKIIGLRRNAVGVGGAPRLPVNYKP